MKAKDFIEQLQSKYDLEDELYFTTPVYNCRIIFDEITIEDKDEENETEVCLKLSRAKRQDFIDELKNEVIENLLTKLNK